MQTPRWGALRPRLLALVLLVAFVAGCAYYNTFYLAKRYYRDAQKAEERSVSDAVAPEASAKYDAVIRQCNKILVDYPKSKWVDDATYMMGAAMYGKRDFSGAIKHLDDLLTKFPESPFVPEARLVQGLSYMKRKDYVIADSVFYALAKAYPNFPRRWELYFNAGESKALQKDYDGALKWYGISMEVAKARRERSDGLRRSGDALFAAGRIDSAQSVYAACLKVEDRGDKRIDVALKRGQALRELRRYQEALDFLEYWKPIAEVEHRDGELALRIYECIGLLGRHGDAIAGYRKLIEKSPRTPVAFEAQFQIGYLYESAKGDLDQAAKEYDKLKTEPPSEFQRQAARRAQNLATLREFQATMSADTTQARARAAFRLAELYYFEMGRKDSAITQYRTVEFLFPASAYAPKSAYARLWIAAYDRNDTLAAEGLTDSIAQKYRGTRFAESALYLWKTWSRRSDRRTALFDSLLANPDTSAASRFVEEAEAKPASIGESRPDSAGGVSDKELERMSAEAAALRARKWAELHGKPGTGASQDTLSAAADSTRSARPDSVTAAPPQPQQPPPQPPPPNQPSPADTAGTIYITPSR